MKFHVTLMVATDGEIMPCLYKSMAEAERAAASIRSLGWECWAEIIDEDTARFMNLI